MSAHEKRARRLGMFVQDELADIASLEGDEVKAYFALRFRSIDGWPSYPELPEGYLPDDDRRLQLASGLGAEAWAAAQGVVLGFFVKVRRGKGRAYLHERDVESIAVARKRAGSGKTGGEAKALANEVAEGGATAVAKPVAKGVAKEPARGVAKRAARTVANDVAKRLASPVANGVANQVANGLAKHVAKHAAKAVAKAVAPPPDPSSQTAVEPAATAEAEDGSRSGLEIPPRTPGFPQVQQPDGDARARRLAAAAGGSVA